MNQPQPLATPPWLRLLASPHLAVFALAWLIVVVSLGTLAQADLGLYRAQARWFDAWIIPAFGWLPLPGSRSALAVLVVGLIAHLGTERGLRQPGLALVHGGVALLLIGGLLAGAFRREGVLTLAEGASGQQIELIGRSELVLVEPGDRELFRFGEDLLRDGGRLSHPDLDLAVAVCAFHPHASLIAGQLRPLPRERERSLEHAGIELELAEGPLALRLGQVPQVTAAGWMLGLRPARVDLPFRVHLHRFEQELHPGTGVARAYRSQVDFSVDGVTRSVLISMNQPLRHGAWTLYQQGFQQDGRTVSVFAVVEDRFQRLPYWSAAIITLGLIWQVFARARRRP